MMKHIGGELKRALSKTRATERGELMKYFCERLNNARRGTSYLPITLGRMGRMLEKIPTKDLYYIKSSCEQAENFSRRFWYLLNPEKYENGKKLRNMRRSKLK